MELQIKKAKINDRLFLTVEYTETKPPSEKDEVHISNDVSKKCRDVIHDDLKNAFFHLKPHLVLICELLDQKDFDPNSFDRKRPDSIYLDERLNDYEVTGFSIGGSDEHEGVVLIGRKNLKSGMVLNLISPFTKWDPEFTEYAFCVDLCSDIDDCIAEVKEYLNGKHAPSKQLQLFNEDSETDDSGTENDTITITINQ